MAQYTIKHLENLTGIKAHTIRAWEQRYAILKPKRTSTNIRYYNDEDLKTILNLSILNRNGYKISKLVGLTKEERNSIILEMAKKTEHSAVAIEELILATIEFDEKRFEIIMQNQIDAIGFEDVVETIIYPLFSRIGILWQVGSISPAQEHFMSNLIRQKLIVAIDRTETDYSRKSPLALLYLRENEWHEMGLLYYAFHLKQKNYQVIYLGQSTPLEDVLATIDSHQPDIVFTTFVQSINQKDIDAYVHQVLNKIETTHAQLWVSGQQSEKLSLEHDRLIHIPHIADLKALL